LGAGLEKSFCGAAIGTGTRRSSDTHVFSLTAEAAGYFSLYLENATAGMRYRMRRYMRCTGI
jgi:hypothetical protein